MTTLTESVYTGEFLVSEANNTLSREQVRVLPDLDVELRPGTVLGKRNDTDVHVPLSVLASDGSEQAAGVLYSTTTGGEEIVIIARGAEVDKQLLIWPVAITEEQLDAAIAELAALGIILR